ncbi:beta-galactosidase [Carboxydochorda subterranea]|uniref:beta-galactosidase n=1 Tax=Carboxydichorda subterranea TaxID=3109565 RepID=A0ABZ1BY60_9FIRM|nr:beta-galactosidase [Limnochorda sp. L945t]WRP17523.1 beta-galactosidase [Limnochorda sp. L945t]
MTNGSALPRPFLPVAAWYTAGPSRATMVEPLGPDGDDIVRRDLAHLREAGFNTVRGWIDWASGESSPGEYHFEALDRLLRHAGEMGLRVVLQLYLDSAPDWILQEFPDGRYVSQGGQAIDSQGSPGFCYDHPGVRQAAEHFMRAVAERVKDHAAFLAYDVWSEPHIVQWAYFDYLPQPALFCYCHHSKQRFRRWLKGRYQDLAALNRAWYRGFVSWEAVDPPRFISLMTYTDFIDWQRFIIAKITEDLAWRARTIKSVDPVHPVTSHSAVPAVMVTPLVEQGEPDDWAVTKVVDIWGTSFYPKHVGAKETADPAVRGAYLDSTRSACASVGKPFWLGELQGGHGYVGTFAEPVTAADIRAWTWGPISHGAKGLNFYAWRPMSRGYESAGFGLTHPDGSPTERSKAAGEVARLVDRYADLFAAAQVPQADAAILWNNDANILWGCLREKSPYVPSRALLGVYRALFERHYPVDFVHPDQIAGVAGGAQGRAARPVHEEVGHAGAGGDAGWAGHDVGPGAALGLAPGPEPIEVGRYRVIYMPFSIMVRRDVARGLAAFVEGGGTVVAEARTGWNDEAGVVDRSVPGSGLRELFGAQEHWTAGRRDLQEPVVLFVDPAPGVSGFEGGRVTGAFYQQALEPLEAEVVGRFQDGEPAVTVRRAGRGQAVLVGSWVSLAYHVQRDPASGAFLAGFAQAAGARRPVLVEGASPGQVEARLSRGETREQGPFGILYVFNHSADELAVRLAVDPPAGAGRFELRELTAQDGRPGALGSGKVHQAVVWPGPDGRPRIVLDDVRLLPWAVAVVLIRPE